MTIPLFTLIYPSNRPQHIERVVKLWRDRASDPNRVEIIVCVDSINKECVAVASVLQKKVEVVTPAKNEIGEIVANSYHWELCIRREIQDTPPFNYVRAANLGARSANGEILIVISDDFLPLNQWDEAILEELRDKSEVRIQKDEKGAASPPHLHPSSLIPHPFREAVLLVGDANRTHIATLPVLTRKRLERFGGHFYHPDYQSVFCDTELTARARMDGVLIDAEHLVFEHQHPKFNNGRPADDSDRIHDGPERWASGERVFARRAMQGFPNIIDPSDVPANKLLPYVACIQATRDDLCLTEVCERLIEEGVKNFGFCAPKQHWDGTDVPAADSAQVQVAAVRVKELGAHFVRFWNDDLYVKCIDKDAIGSIGYPGMNRSVWETRYRNFCMHRLRGFGFEHLLIVDGDELWKRGLMQKLDWFVRGLHPSSVVCDMIPLVGQPAYAVAAARDKCLVYVGRGETFKHIRSPQNVSHYMPLTGAYHFTAVRRTVEELIAKMRKSGHYDDPDYLFEDWIANKLPNLHHGMQNVHMWKKDDGGTWPEARYLSKGELREIPERLHQYIAGENVQHPTLNAQHSSPDSQSETTVESSKLKVERSTLVPSEDHE